jgi:hypothetical protein
MDSVPKTKRQSHILLPPYGGLEQSAAGGSSRPNSGVLQHTSGFIRLDARHLPEIPSGRRSSHLSHRNQAVRRRLLQTPFPSRNHHRRAIEMLSEIELIEPKFLSQCSNPPRPCWQGRGHELTGPGHSCLQDNKSLHILRNAHFRARSMDWNRAVASCDPIPRRTNRQRTAKAKKLSRRFAAPGHPFGHSLPFWLNKSTTLAVPWPGGKSLEVSRPNSKQNP